MWQGSCRFVTLAGRVADPLWPYPCEGLNSGDKMERSGGGVPRRLSWSDGCQEIPETDSGKAKIEPAWPSRV